MRASARLVHESPHRLRIRIPERRKDSAYFTHLTDTLREIPEVEATHATPLTGSVLILHRGRAQSVLRSAEKLGLFRIVKSESAAKPWPEKIFRKIDQSSEKISQTTAGQWDLTTIAATSMVGLSVFQVLRGQLLPPAWTLFSEALVMLSKNRKPDHDSAEVIGVHNI